LRRETKSAREFAERALRFNAERGLTFHVAISDILLGSVLVGEERDAGGLTKIRDGTAASRATGAGVVSGAARCGATDSWANARRAWPRSRRLRAA
jgi:hypothetical protein